MILFKLDLNPKHKDGYVRGSEWSQTIQIRCNECDTVLAEFRSPALTNPVIDLLKKPIYCYSCEKDTEAKYGSS